MKLFLLFCCWFNAALAASWQPYEPEVSYRIKFVENFLNNSINDLTMQIDHLSTTARENSERGLIYFQKPAGELVDKMAVLRTEMLQFQMNITMPDQVMDMDKVYERLYDENGKLTPELRQFYNQDRRDHSKHLALSVVAYQNIAQNASLPDASTLIDDVEKIISQEETVRKVGNDYSKKVLNDSYRELDRTLVNAAIIISGNSKQFYDSIKTARKVSVLLRTIEETKQAETLENALDLAEFPAYEMFKLVPINSNEKVVEVVKLARIAYRAGKNLKALLESHPSVAAFAQTSQGEWIANSSSLLTSKIDELSRDVSKNQQMNVTYIPGLLSDQVAKMNHFRAEMKAFLLKAIKSNISSEMMLPRNDTLDQQFQRLNNDFELVKEETVNVIGKVEREWRKWATLFIAACRKDNIYDDELPDAEKLIAEVKLIMSKEKTINNHDGASNNTNEIATEVENFYKQFNNKFFDIINEKKDRFLVAKQRALSMKARNKDVERENPELSKWFDKIFSFNEMYKHFPIDSSMAVDQVLIIVGELIESAREIRYRKFSAQFVYGWY